MAHCGTLRDLRFSDAAEDIRGAKLYGLNDEKLGMTGPVMHCEGTDRNITPTTQQMPGNSPSERAAEGASGWAAGPEGASVESGGSTSARVVPAGTDSVVISNSAVGIGGRWDTFQSRLRERRKEAVAGCKTCSVGSATARGTESTGALRKAV